MEYGTMRCYRCNALMESGGYIHCSTCRIEDSIKKSSQNSNKVDSELYELIRHSLMSAAIQNSTPQNNSQPAENVAHNSSRFVYVSPVLTEEEKKQRDEWIKKSSARNKREATRNNIIIWIMGLSALSLLLYLGYQAYRFGMFILGL